jgi:hypothetical protein
MNTLILYLLRYWNGRLKLLHAFLHVYLPLTLAWIAVKAVISDPFADGVVVGSITIAVGLILSIYKGVGLWRCANSAEKVITKYLARLVAISPLIIAISGLVIGFVAYFLI